MPRRKLDRPICSLVEKNAILFVCLLVEDAKRPVDVRLLLLKDRISGFIESNIAIVIRGHFKIHRGRSGLTICPEPTPADAVAPGGIRICNKSACDAVDITRWIAPIGVHQVILSWR